MIKVKIVFYRVVFIVPVLLISACSTTNYTISNTAKAVNIKPSNGKWLIDYPVLYNVDNSLATKTITYYKESLKKTFTQLYAVTDFPSFSTLNHIIKKDPKVVLFYKDKTKCDYLIETEIKLLKNDLAMIQLFPDESQVKELNIRITVYDINSGQVALDKEYYFVNSFEGNNDIAFSPKLDKFVNKAVKRAIKEFRKKYNWKRTDATTIAQQNTETKQ